ncbi:type I-F CRISPR-associated protein Csy1 [Acinetobacter indicus]|uniref:type I-F CRISPR-associated protein Csy1 n=1 Tax=Acinetobacter indicus TaxID=756892 RepID=UPI00209B045D|nr:type I-F CRISPR-associated protein Csy1 [Acinetobacter indicus]MCO8099539.1 type I-F CRISPR-associated protein Csy1 [Acinetobacter indicus]MCO8105143.1 type I-F CRISPR-associated protein Csy1 [Acinetobacter indicus]MCO8110817.1 type I-F CRISPR-associated protein Csy1 [Acinetobacter indicus]
MQNIIVSYLEARKEDFLQSKINSKLRGKKNEFDEEARLKVRLENQAEADAKYNIEVWLDNIIRKVKPNVTTHPAKFTNAKIDTDTSQIFLGRYVNDGYIKTGNVHLKNKVDVSGNSATNTIVYELYDLLDQDMGNDQKLIHKFEENNESLIQFFEKNKADFEYIKAKCLKVYYGEKSTPETHSSTRQVYFPIGDNEYHLLSVKTASMLMYEVKNRIDGMNIWVDGQHARSFKKENKFLEDGFSEVFDITEIGFSNGDFIKMGNYSLLNVKNKGIAYLLSSCPPILEKRTIRLPRTDFFVQCLYRKNYQDSFMQLHKFIQLDLNNIDIRTAIRNILQFVIDQVILQGLKIRESYPEGWSQQEYYANLPKLQRIWLDEMYAEQRENDSEWRNELSEDIARWILRSYEKVISESEMLGTAEINDVKQRVEESLRQAKEFF